MMALFIWVPVSLILIGVCVMCWLSAWDIHRLRRHGVRTTAQVSGFRHVKDSDGDPRHLLLVIFCLSDGTEVEGESMSSAPDGSSGLAPGDATDIIYDPAKPTRICVLDFEAHRIRARDFTAYAISALATALLAALVLAEAFAS